MNIKKFFTASATLMLVLSMLLCAVSCDGETQTETDTGTETQTETEASTETEIHYEDINASDYVYGVRYKGLEILLDSADESREDALWEAIYATARIDTYPEQKVLYYFNQTKEAYMYIVNYNEEDYALLLKSRATSEEQMMEDARAMVREDLVYSYIVDMEKVALTEEEKTANFDKYVEKFANEFKKPTSYIVAEMSDYIYEAMLYDKTMELLLASNTFTVKGETTAEPKAQQNGN